MKKVLNFVLILSFLLTACSSATETPPASTVTPIHLEPTLTETLTPVPSETPIPPLEEQSVTQESIAQFANAMQKAGINITAEQILQQGLQIQTVTGVDGKQYEIVFAHLDPDPNKQSETFEGNFPLMVKNDKGEWEYTTFRNIGDIAGVSFGTSVNGAEDWHNKLYQERASEFQTVTPIGYTVRDVLYRLEDPTYKKFITDLYKGGVTIRMYNLFWSADHRINGKPNMEDPLWKGAPNIGSPASEEYKAMVGEQMDADIRNFFKQAPFITQLGFANEALWEYQGNTGWEDSPYYRAFGKDWLAEAYLRTFKIATQEFHRVPGKDLTLFYGDYNFVFANGKANFVFDVLKYTKAEVIKRAAAEGLTLPDPPFVVDEQGHLNLTNKNELGEFGIADLNEKTLEANLKRFSEIGPVWMCEITIRGGDRNERTNAVSILIRSGMRAGVSAFLFWELMQKNGMYANGDLLFDPNDSYKNTATTYELFKVVIENIKE
jgi:hypothetical protein